MAGFCTILCPSSDGEGQWLDDTCLVCGCIGTSKRLTINEKINIRSWLAPAIPRVVFTLYGFELLDFYSSQPMPFKCDYSLLWQPKNFVEWFKHSSKDTLLYRTKRP